MKDLFYKALEFYGLEEVTGEEHNPEILAMFAEIGCDWVQDDETSWCSAFVGYLCKQLNYERSNELTARSWLKVGEECAPEIGCIVVLWRVSVSDWRGHVGFYINSDNRYIYILGGNQDNSVCIKRYPRERLLGYRRLKCVSKNCSVSRLKKILTQARRLFCLR
jgi:uncharacterized protein (TIGR02594 family)